MIETIKAPNTTITIRASDLDRDGYYAASDSLTCGFLECEVSVKFHGDLYVGGNLDVDGQRIALLKQFIGLYRYRVWAALLANGERWVRMGCLWKSLAEWDQIGIRQSNRGEFPDDGATRSEERVRAFEFAKAASLLMELPAAPRVELPTALHVGGAK